ncbi:MAG TPA: O-antigen ligase family protein [Terriglobales bacterium]
MRLFRIIFAGGLIAFIATNFPLGIAGVYARFPLIALMLAGCVMLTERVRFTGMSGMLMALYGFLVYSFVTSFWTENIWLSLIRWLLYVTVCLAFFISGSIVGQNCKPDVNPFDSLKWVFLPLLVSSLLAIARGIGWQDGNFRGFSGNSNALGASIMFCTPWLLYELKRSWNTKWRKRGLVVLGVFTSFVMLATHSRAALGSFVLLILFAGLQLKLGRKLVLAYAGLLLLIAIYAIRPSAFDFIYHSYVNKRADTILASRGEQMEDSWEAAREGGVFGAGIGVSVGISQYWEFTTLSRISREKGNSFLAIVEETGLVGLSFYVAMLLGMFMALRKYGRTLDPETKFVANIAMGYFLASLLHGQFEAWFLSFGPDVSVYWGTIGLAMGYLARKNTEYERNTRVEAATGARVFVPAPVSRG